MADLKVAMLDYDCDSLDAIESIGRNVAHVCAGRRPPAVVDPEVLEKVSLS